jgi:hypothetical protein
MEHQNSDMESKLFSSGVPALTVRVSVTSDGIRK